MKDTIIVKENGEVRLIEANEELINSLIGRSNPCAICANANDYDCMKVNDGLHKDITKYDFITDGYQTFDENGEFDSLVVGKCNNFKECVRKPKRARSLEEIQKEKRKLESLKIFAYDGENLEEANRIERYQVLCGNIADTNGAYAYERIMGKSHK